jgi:hypothetical protein
MQALHMPAI